MKKQRLNLVQMMLLTYHSIMKNRAMEYFIINGFI